MERDFGREIDELRDEIRALRGDRSSVDRPARDLGAVRRFYGKTEADFATMTEEIASKGRTIPEWGADLAARALSKLDSGVDDAELYEDGIVSFAGIYRAANADGHMWNLEQSVGALMALDESVVERVLSAIGNRIRVRILKTVLERPSTANELVEALGMNTTGKAYHHLRLLESADLIHKDDEGRYRFHGHRVSAFFAALTAVDHAIDDEFTSGDLGKLPLRSEDV